MKPIAIFMHGLFFIGQPPVPLPNAGCILSNQITQMRNSGLWQAATEIHVGINGSEESIQPANSIIPVSGQVHYHGLQSRNENLTVMMLLDWAKTHPGWNILYVHTKSASHDPNSDYGRKMAVWRDSMMTDLVTHWRRCVEDLETHDIACMTWLWEMGWDKSQHIPGGNFLWITSDFAAKLPSLYDRARIKEDGIGALSSRYEAEVAWGNGPRPNVKAYRERLPI